MSDDRGPNADCVDEDLRAMGRNAKWAAMSFAALSAHLSEPQPEVAAVCSSPLTISPAERERRKRKKKLSKQAKKRNR